MRTETRRWRRYQGGEGCLAHRAPPIFIKCNEYEKVSLLYAQRFTLFLFFPYGTERGQHGAISSPAECDCNTESDVQCLLRDATAVPADRSRAVTAGIRVRQPQRSLTVGGDAQVWDLRGRLAKKGRQGDGREGRCQQMPCDMRRRQRARREARILSIRARHDLCMVRILRPSLPGGQGQQGRGARTAGRQEVGEGREWGGRGAEDGLGTGLAATRYRTGRQGAQRATARGTEACAGWQAPEAERGASSGEEGCSGLSHTSAPRFVYGPHPEIVVAREEGRGGRDRDDREDSRGNMGQGGGDGTARPGGEPGHGAQGGEGGRHLR